jgi:hypothetical protein
MELNRRYDDGKQAFNIRGSFSRPVVRDAQKTVQKPASERLLENVLPASSAAGRNPEE